MAGTRIQVPKFEKLWVPESNKLWIVRGVMDASAPLPKRKAIEVLPKVYSFDDRFLKFLGALSHELNDHPALQPQLDENMMVGENGIHTSFDRLRTVAGFASNPLSWVPTHNDSLCEELKIPADFRSQRHKDIFDEFFDIIFGQWKPTAIKVPKHSTLGIPMLNEYDAGYKRECAMFLYANLDQIFKLVKARDFDRLARDFGHVYCFNLNTRGQVDEPGKVRLSNTIEYAKSGGISGERVPADKKVEFKDGRKYDDFSAMRVRIVQGASWMLNCILQPISSGHMYAMFDEFSSTFHHRDPNEIAYEAAISGDATASDVDTYDASMREFLLRRMFNCARKYWPEELIDMAEILYFAPYFTRPLDLSSDVSHRAQFIGNPYDPINKGVSAGNRSGHAWTSFVAKTMKVFDSLCVIDDIYGDVLGNIRQYLKGKGSISLKNNGDDEVAIGSKISITAYRKVRYDGEHGYFKISPEKGQGFSGSLISWAGTGKAIPRLHTIFEKFYVPERSIGGVFRPRWPIGFLTRLEAFDKHPSGHYAAEIHRRLWHDMMAPHFGSFGEILIDAMEKLDVEYDGLTAIDKEVLDDPEKLHYKYSDDDVSPEILEKVVARIQPEEFPWAEQMYNGSVIHKTK